MPMGVVSDDEFEAEVSNKKPVIPDNVIRRPFHGRNPGDNNVPSSIREIIADDTGKTGKELAQTFDISQSSVAAYQHGATSTATYDRPAPALKEVVNRKRERITRKSNRALIRVLDKMDSDEFDAKLDACKATELSTVAANLSRVVEKVQPKDDTNIKQQNIIFYAPTPLKTDTFEVIDLGRKQIEGS